jgi:tetratricopeptide (TPR) repeat protein
MVELAGIYLETGNADALDRLQDGAARQLQDPLVFYINYGVLSMGAAEFDRARWAFERALRIVPEDLATRSTLADAYLHLGEREYAVKALTDGEQHLPEEARVAYHLRLLSLYQDMHEAELALAQAEKVVELDPADPEHHGLVLVQLVRAGRGDEAMERLNDFVREFMPQDPVATKRVRADVLLERGEVERALGEMRILHTDNPGDAQIEFALAHLYAEAGQVGNAERHYRRLIESLEGDDERAGLYVRSLNNLAFTLCEAEVKLEEALGLVEQALELEPSADYILDTKGRILYRMGRLEESQTWLREAEKRSFGDPEILGHLGDLHRALGQPSTARRYYDRALGLEPGNESIRERLATLEAELSPGGASGAAASTP